ncbi:MAG: histidine kinase N-terminal 7TM domain-containing protein [Candidatus Methanofastidiosia archaeon]
MELQGIPYVIPPIIAVAASIVSTFYILQRYRAPEAKILVMILLAGSGWMISQILSVLSATEQAKIFWGTIGWPPLVLVYILWLIFTFQYTGREKWITHRNIVLLSIVPAITVILSFTSKYHGMMYASIECVTEDEFSLLKISWGPWYFIHDAYATILILFGDLLLIHLLIRAPRFYRRQIISLLFASFLFQIISFLGLFKLSPFSSLHIGVLLFSVASPVLALSIYRFRLADIVPVAQESVIDGMNDGVLVLDAQNRIMDVNPLVQRLIGRSTAQLIGQPVEEVWPIWLDQIGLRNENKSEEIILNLEDGQRIYDGRTSPLTDWHGNLVSQVIVLRDITERKQAEMRLKSIFEASKLINSTMDIHKIFKFISDSVRELIGFDHFAIFLVSKDRNHIHRAYAVADTKDEKELVLPSGEGLVGHCITTKEVVLLRNAYTDERAENIPDSTEPMSQIAIPLIIEDEAVGALHVSKSEENAYENRDVDVLKPLSEIISSAIRNSSLYTEIKELNTELEKKIKERSKRIEILVSTRQNLQRETSLQKGLMTIVDSMKMFGFDRVGVFLIDPKGEELVFHSGKSDNLPEITTSVSLENKEYFGVRCVLEKKTIHVKDAGLTEGTQIDESTSFTWVPIVVQDEAFAALTARNMNKVVTDEDVKDLEILAGMCAAFIDRTRVQIEPVAENHLKTEIIHQLTPKECYLVLEKIPEKSFEIFVDLVTHGVSGFIISREHPEKIKEKYNLVKTPLLWLSRSETKDTINPDDLPKLTYIIEDFTRKSEESVILLDGLEYLITQDTFGTVLKFLQGLKDTIVLNNSQLIIPFHKGTLSKKEFSTLEREITILAR